MKETLKTKTMSTDGMVRFFTILPKETHIDFLRLRHVMATISVILSLIGLAAFAMIWMGQAKLGLEFTGGTALTVELTPPVAIDAARAALARGGFGDAQLQDIRGTNQLAIRTKTVRGAEEEAQEQLLQLLRREFPDRTITIASSDFISATVGRELRDKAIWAVLFATLGLLAYIAFRFDFKFGVAAAITTFHDVLVVLGIVWLTGMEITLLVITALLTLAGYSLTDTVVIFDRVRENLRKHQREPLMKIINDSINQVLSRTLLTSLTTLLAVVALYLLGGPVLRDFSFVLILGVIFGTYSSIYIACPLLLLGRRRGLTAHVKQ
ncbi:MAG: protein translocase subunit SecF [Candidatus Bipolaricaulota bacterium]|nr:protein translocase subunit SecF [Candidatus Bipolaricaulota bacterium]MCS7274979.1 protein translocase subunit SecF [Candidatus Bipolaricaulota bacterium]MDW8110354.1 protein translocase subunit SecF [Candidatus Bipolaricaulota bacterium]MDW8328750.1 protein translocase subunit SecF [Candidatus Bipolaricaulota bacterium]